MSTLTASLHQLDTPYLPSGAYVVSSKISSTATGTASSKVLLAKVPLGAVIHDFVFYLEDGQTDNTWKLGLQLPEGLSGSWTHTESALMTESSSTSVLTHRPLGGKLPYKVTFTDTERFAWIVATSVLAWSAVVEIRFSALISNGQNNI